MYHNLFAAITNAITILQQAQRDAEEIYINSEPMDLSKLKITSAPEDAEKEAESETI
jgi:hypothetical protein